MPAYARPNHSQIMALATSRAEDCPECRCKHSPLLEKATTEGLQDACMTFLKMATAFANDGILDEGEYAKLATYGEKISSTVNRILETGLLFVMPGFYVAERNGSVCLCYSVTPCGNEDWEHCTRCPKGHARFLPRALHDYIMQVRAMSDTTRNPRGQQAQA